MSQEQPAPLPLSQSPIRGCCGNNVLTFRTSPSQEIDDYSVHRAHIEKWSSLMVLKIYGRAKLMLFMIESVEPGSIHIHRGVENNFYLLKECKVRGFDGEKVRWLMVEIVRRCFSKEARSIHIHSHLVNREKQQWRKDIFSRRRFFEDKLCPFFL